MVKDFIHDQFELDMLVARLQNKKKYKKYIATIKRWLNKASKRKLEESISKIQLE